MRFTRQDSNCEPNRYEVVSPRSLSGLVGRLRHRAGRFFGHSADTKSHAQTSVCASITSA
jgi:hypothetical protein